MILISSSMIFCSCDQNIKRSSKSDFFGFLNNYQSDSLQSLLADNFKIVRTFTTNKTDRKRFFEYYIPVSKNFNSKFEILKSEVTGESETYLVKDESDYLRLLDIDFPKWNITLKKNSKGQIESAIFDTTETFQKYLQQSNSKGKAFENWLHLKYPDEKIENLYTTSGLMLKRLREYLNK